jgi:hypothetical protein
MHALPLQEQRTRADSVGVAFGLYQDEPVGRMFDRAKKRTKYGFCRFVRFSFSERIFFGYFWGNPAFFLVGTCKRGGDVLQ